MIAWHRPHLPRLCEPSAAPIRVFDTPRQDVVTLDPGERAGVYVCGITPYDATHMGHAATYVTFDLLNRVLRDAGHEVTYVQNVTDVDDPLLERAARDGVEWTDLAAAEIQLFRDDMTALRVLPPEYYLGVVESIADIEAAVSRLVDSGATYALPVTDGTAANATDASAGPSDVYLDLTRQPSFGRVCGWSREQMLQVYADRGGDPDRPGKRDPLDPLLWRAARTGEPSWPSARLGDGRPGWHIECTAIAVKRLGVPFDVQGGGTDLVFPHHEMSAVQAGALAGAGEFARAYVHQAMVGLHGQKMSKSRGNLVLVSRLRAQGEDPMAMRLALLAQHYRTPWDWHDELLEAARERLGHWRRACAAAAGPPAEDLITAVRQRLADDLDAPGALHVVDDWAQATENGHGSDTSAPAQVAEALDALLGVRI